MDSAKPKDERRSPGPESDLSFGERFYLELNVAARPGWREDPRFLAGLTS